MPVIKQPPSEEQHHFENAVVFGANGTIGEAFCQQLAQQGCHTIYRVARNIEKLSSAPTNINVVDLSYDLLDEASINKVVEQLPTNIDLVVIATGWLHDLEAGSNKLDQNKSLEEQKFAPEKTFKSLDPTHLMKSWQINFLGPSMILKNLLIHLKHRQHKTIFAVLSARVGSISDNKMGGWYSYRSSKAALNMMIKNLSIELQRLRSKSLIVALQPGTTDSALSKPFQKFIKQEQLQSPEFTAQHLLSVLRTLESCNSGELMDFEGNIITP